MTLLLAILLAFAPAHADAPKHLTHPHRVTISAPKHLKHPHSVIRFTPHCNPLTGRCAV